MTPEQMAGLVKRWVRFYTRDLPTAVAQRRIDELDADLHDQIAHGRAAGISDRRVMRTIASRMIRGIAADAAWRGRKAKARPSTLGEGAAMPGPVGRSALRVALGVAFILSLPLVAMLVTDGVVWSLADFVLAGVLLAIIGVALELAVRKAGTLAAAFGIAGLGLAAAVLGQADDAPGLVLIGILLMASGGALGVRRAQRSR